MLSGDDVRLRDELLYGEVLYNLLEVKIVIEARRRHFNTVRPHAPLCYRLPAPEVFVPTPAWSAAQLRPAPPTTPPLHETRELTNIENGPLRVGQLRGPTREISFHPPRGKLRLRLWMSRRSAYLIHNS